MDFNNFHNLDDGYDSDFDFAAYDAVLDLDGASDPIEEDPAVNSHTPKQQHADDNIVDLTGDSDVEFHPSPTVAANNTDVVAPMAIENQSISEAECVQMVLNVLPDVSIAYVIGLISATTPTPAACELIISQLLDEKTYPKERDEVASRKRKRQMEEEAADFEAEDYNPNDASYHKNALDLLKEEFLNVPVRHIDQTLKAQKTLLKAHGTIRQQLLRYTTANNFNLIKNPRPKRGFEQLLAGMGSPLPRELEAARIKEKKEADKRQKAEDKERAEQDNRQKAQQNGEMSDCLCCFDSFPINRMTSCSGDTVHFFCLLCAKQYGENEMGLGRAQLVCFADSNCGGTFSRRQLQEFLGEKSFDRLEHMQQQHELAAAGLDFLSECPFCDFKAEYPPVEFDKEFRCLNPKCEKVSCRLCQSETHIPLSCEEFKNDNKLSIRHQVEEAMSSALIRHCNNCKHAFLKSDGCNKITCTHCRNLQCYVCSQNVKDYSHFSDGTGDARRAGAKLCPLYDNVEARHAEEVKKAAADAMAKARTENPDISEADLAITVSESVRKAETTRQQAQARHAGVEGLRAPFRIVNNGAVVQIQGQQQQPVPMVAEQNFVPMDFNRIMQNHFPNYQHHPFGNVDVFNGAQQPGQPPRQQGAQEGIDAPFAEQQYRRPNPAGLRVTQHQGQHQGQQRVQAAQPAAAALHGAHLATRNAPPRPPQARIPHDHPAVVEHRELVARLERLHAEALEQGIFGHAYANRQAQAPGQTAQPHRERYAALQPLGRAHLEEHQAIHQAIHHAGQHLGNAPNPHHEIEAYQIVRNLAFQGARNRQAQYAAQQVAQLAARPLPGQNQLAQDARNHGFDRLQQNGGNRGAGGT